MILCAAIWPGGSRGGSMVIMFANRDSVSGFKLCAPTLVAVAAPAGPRPQ